MNLSYPHNCSFAYLSVVDWMQIYDFISYQKQYMEFFYELHISLFKRILYGDTVFPLVGIKEFGWWNFSVSIDGYDSFWGGFLFLSIYQRKI